MCHQDLRGSDDTQKDEFHLLDDHNSYWSIFPSMDSSIVSLYHPENFSKYEFLHGFSLHTYKLLF